MVERLVKVFQAKFYTDPAYISHDFKDKLKDHGIDLTTKYRKKAILLIYRKQMQSLETAE